MQAILKSEHHQFYDWLHKTMTKQDIQDSDLDILGTEMLSKYSAYEQKIDEIRQIIFQYKEIKQQIRNKIKLNLKYKHDMI